VASGLSVTSVGTLVRREQPKDGEDREAESNTPSAAPYTIPRQRIAPTNASPCGCGVHGSPRTP
jgi:hypothetical protein